MESSNQKKLVNIIQSVSIGVINVLLLLLVCFNLFGSGYLPNQGTGVSLIIIGVLGTLFISSMLIQNINVSEIKNIFSAIKTGTVKQLGDVSKVILLDMIRLLKVFSLLPIIFFMSYLFLTYTGEIEKYHTSLPSFDLFFNLIVFSILAQFAYISAGSSNVIHNKLFKPNISSIMIFAILNIINGAMVIAMWADLVLFKTDG